MDDGRAGRCTATATRLVKLCRSSRRAAVPAKASSCPGLLTAKA
ncbi:hypothetical protein [Nocardiopsis sp. CNR-923]|nr:hypothetical protein [Nocardiopsis sp. CNR-923]